MRKRFKLIQDVNYHAWTTNSLSLDTFSVNSAYENTRHERRKALPSITNTTKNLICCGGKIVTKLHVNQTEII